MLLDRGRAPGQSCQSAAYHLQYTSLFCVFLPLAPALKFKILDICNNISTWPCHAEAAKEKQQQGQTHVEQQ